MSPFPVPSSSRDRASFQVLCQAAEGRKSRMQPGYLPKNRTLCLGRWQKDNLVPRHYAVQKHREPLFSLRDPTDVGQRPGTPHDVKEKDDMPLTALILPKNARNPPFREEV